MDLAPIGIVHSPVIQDVDENWGSIISEIHILDSLISGLQGLSQFSHAIIVFHLHKAKFDPSTDLLRRPRGQDDMPLLGIFAQRAKHRPNPIGVTAVQILSIKENIVRLKGLDAIDGTPVLDIKPYFPMFDRVDNVVVPEWVDRLMEGYF